MLISLLRWALDFQEVRRVSSAQAVPCFLDRCSFGDHSRGLNRVCWLVDFVCPSNHASLHQDRSQIYKINLEKRKIVNFRRKSQNMCVCGPDPKLVAHEPMKFAMWISGGNLIGEGTRRYCGSHRRPIIFENCRIKMSDFIRGPNQMVPFWNPNLFNLKLKPNLIDQTKRHGVDKNQQRNPKKAITQELQDKHKTVSILNPICGNKTRYSVFWLFIFQQNMQLCVVIRRFQFFSGF